MFSQNPILLWPENMCSNNIYQVLWVPNKFILNRRPNYEKWLNNCKFCMLKICQNNNVLHKNLYSFFNALLYTDLENLIWSNKTLWWNIQLYNFIVKSISHKITIRVFLEPFIIKCIIGYIISSHKCSENL